MLTSKQTAHELSSRERALLGRLNEIGLLDLESKARVESLLILGNSTLTRIVIDLGLTAEGDFLAAACSVLGLAMVTAAQLDEAPDLGDLGLSVRFLRTQRILPVSAGAEELVVVVSDPFDIYAQRALAMASGRRIKLLLAPRRDLELAIDRRFPDEGAAQSDASQDPLLIAGDIEKLRESASEAPTIRFVNDLVTRAIQAGASDIHLEPQDRALRIRFRIDGVLHEDQFVPSDRTAAILSRLKILAGLNIAERRLPQDGAVKLAAGGKQVDLRIGTAPVADGEAASIRILDRSNVALDLDALGFDAAFQTKWIQLLRRPNGIVLVTGPTGSGKTTTLYASLQKLNTVDRKIVSIEDPIEYRIRGINQIQVNAEIGLTFAAAFRSILRHDPDIVFVGEIRDAETAKIAIQAALAGRLVLSTLHTNSAAGAITRLLDMGAEDYLLASTLAGVLAQRLVRRRCPLCAPLDETGRCKRCGGTGFAGRTVIHELLPNAEPIERSIVARGGTRAIHDVGVAMGMETLWANGMAKVRAGVTTQSELSRVVHEAA